jgi:hypothetical protein
MRRRKVIKLRIERCRADTQVKVSNLGHPRDSVWFKIYKYEWLFRCMPT